MEHIYSPWRSGYFGEKIEGCVFCHISQNPDLDTTHHVLYRDEYSFCVMNKYPYTPGHFMIIPHIHESDLEKLDSEVWVHMNKLAQKGVGALKDFGARGVNLGLNIGQEGGAGIPDHLHLHLVPRWHGDTNFITTIANTRIYGVDFEEIYQKVKTLFNSRS